MPRTAFREAGLRDCEDQEGKARAAGGGAGNGVGGRHGSGDPAAPFPGLRRSPAGISKAPQELPAGAMPGDQGVCRLRRPGARRRLAAWCSPGCYDAPRHGHESTGGSTGGRRWRPTPPPGTADRRTRPGRRPPACPRPGADRGAAAHDAAGSAGGGPGAAGPTAILKTPLEIGRGGRDGAPPESWAPLRGIRRSASSGGRDAAAQRRQAGPGR